MPILLALFSTADESLKNRPVCSACRTRSERLIGVGYEVKCQGCWLVLYKKKTPHQTKHKASVYCARLLLGLRPLDGLLQKVLHCGCKPCGEDGIGGQPTRRLHLVFELGCHIDDRTEPVVAGLENVLDRNESARSLEGIMHVHVGS